MSGKHPRALVAFLVILVAAMGILLMGLVQAIEGRVAPWLRREQ